MRELIKGRLTPLVKTLFLLALFSYPAWCVKEALLREEPPRFHDLTVGYPLGATGVFTLSAGKLVARRLDAIANRPAVVYLFATSCGPSNRYAGSWGQGRSIEIDGVKHDVIWLAVEATAEDLQEFRDSYGLEGHFASVKKGDLRPRFVPQGWIIDRSGAIQDEITPRLSNLEHKLVDGVPRIASWPPQAIGRDTEKTVLGN